MAKSTGNTETEQDTQRQESENRFQSASLNPNEATQEDQTAATGAPDADEASSRNEFEQKYKDLYEQHLRLSADFDNYRKRTREEQESLVKYGAQKSVLELLPVLDNLERATASLNENSDPKMLYQSFQMMYKQIMEGFSALGVKKIQAVGQPFDPQYHEAVNQMPSEYPENTVAMELQGGYMLNDKVVRPTMVAVSTGPAATEQPAS